MCPTCYSLVQDAVNVHRHELNGLEEMIDKADDLPGNNTSNAKFKEELDELNQTAHDLLERAHENQSKSFKSCLFVYLVISNLVVQKNGTRARMNIMKQ